MNQKKNQATIIKKNFKLRNLEIIKLKGLNHCSIDFHPHRVTAIMGINGSGKSTILHALACCFKPTSGSSQEYNRFPDFFTPHTHSTWIDTKFCLTHSHIQVDTKRGITKPIISVVNYGKTTRWTPIYARRPERQSQYIGLQNLSTLADNRGAGRFANYEVHELNHPNKQLIITQMSKILGRQYNNLVLCKSRTKTFWGLERNGEIYSEHTMGAGEKRIIEILRQIYSPELKNGVVLIDELEALLHSNAFSKLVEILISVANQFKLEIIFTTHRETITEFKDRINICGIWNTGTSVMTLQNINPKILSQLTGSNQQSLKIYVEDDLAKEIIELLLEEKEWQEYVSVSSFGAIDNAYVVLAGMLLSQQPIDDILCVLDGDVDTKDKERENKLKKYLSGQDLQAQDFRKRAIKQIRQFNLEYDLPPKTKAAPEYNHKKWLEEVPVDHNNQSLLAASRQIEGLTDWHYYYKELGNLYSGRHIQEKVITEIKNNNPEKWNLYTKEIQMWIEDKLLDQNLIKKQIEPAEKK